ncbi:MAG: DUF1049 domain-containing protein [Synechococcales bacterium]|nr:DUF1049 domain-containing protein [Synechococcales bacterium]
MRVAIVGLLASIVALWIVAIAILSMQNAELVALQWGNAQTVPLPFGFLLATSAGIGMVGMAILQPLFLGSERLDRGDRNFDDRNFDDRNF